MDASEVKIGMLIRDGNKGEVAQVVNIYRTADGVLCSVEVRSRRTLAKRFISAQNVLADCLPIRSDVGRQG